MKLGIRDYLELYRTTIEDMHHQDTINAQAFVGYGVLLPIFVGLIAFLFGDNSPLSQGHWVGPSKGVVFGAFFYASVYFLVTTRRQERRMDIIRGVLDRLERRLQATWQLDGSPDDLRGLLVHGALRQRPRSWLEGRWSVIGTVLAVVAVALFLFVVLPS